MAIRNVQGEISRILRDAVKVESFTPELVTVTGDSESVKVHSIMVARDFDLIGVTTRPGEPAGHVVGHRDLEGRGSEPVLMNARPIQSDRILKGSARVGDLVRHLALHEYAIIVGPGGVPRIATRSDLSASAVMVYAYGYLASIEQGLKILTAAIVGPSAFERLSAIRQEEVAQRSSHLVGAVDSLYFKELLEIARRSEVRNYAGFGIGAKADDAMRRLAKLRNIVAHPRTGADLPRGVHKQLAELAPTAERIWHGVKALGSRWEVVAQTSIADALGRPVDPRAFVNDSEVAHVISAANPAGVLHSPTDNRRKNDALEAFLIADGHAAIRVVGRSRNSDWAEDALLVSGIGRGRATQIARLFGQTSFFELGGGALRVIRASDGVEVAAC